MTLGSEAWPIVRRVVKWCCVKRPILRDKFRLQPLCTVTVLLIHDVFKLSILHLNAVELIMITICSYSLINNYIYLYIINAITDIVLWPIAPSGRDFKPVSLLLPVNQRKKIRSRFLSIGDSECVAEAMFPSVLGLTCAAPWLFHYDNAADQKCGFGTPVIEQIIQFFYKSLELLK